MTAIENNKMSEVELQSQIQYRLVEELSASEKRYRELVERIREIVFQCDYSGKISFLNSAWADVLGYETISSIGSNLCDYVYESDRSIILDLFSRERKRPSVEEDLEVRFRNIHGDPVWLILSIRNGENGGKIGSLHNINKRKLAEEALQHVNEELESRVHKRTAQLAKSNLKLEEEVEERKKAQTKLNQAFTKLKNTQEELLRIERFAAVGETSGRVAHDVLNPITSIFSRVEHNISQCSHFENVVGYTREIVDDWQNEFRKGTLEPYLIKQNEEGILFIEEDFKILDQLFNSLGDFKKKWETDLFFVSKQIQRVIKIINNLRNSVRFQRSIVELNVTTPIQEALEVLEDQLSKRNIYVQKTFPVDLPVVMADEAELIHLFTNMLRNSIQSIDEKKTRKGVITLTITNMDDRYIEIRIIDNGIGIAEEAKDSVFSFDYSTKNREIGTGLGLGICRRIARELGGDIVLEESVYEDGATFLITLPVSEILREIMQNQTS